MSTYIYLGTVDSAYDIILIITYIIYYIIIKMSTFLKFLFNNFLIYWVKRKKSALLFIVIVLFRIADIFKLICILIYHVNN